MISIKIMKWRAAGLLINMLGFAMLAGGCAFSDRQVSLNPVYTAAPLKTAEQSEINVMPPEDKRGYEKTNLVGYVRNGYYIRTADVLADKNVNDWVQSCIAENLKRAGFKVVAGNLDAGGLCVSTAIRSLICDSYFSISATVILDVKLKKYDASFFEQSFTGKASQPNWLASSGEYQEALTNAMKQCLDKMMPVLIKELEREATETKLKKQE